MYYFLVVNFAIRYPLAVVLSYLVSPAGKFEKSPKVGTLVRPGSLFDHERQAIGDPAVPAARRPAGSDQATRLIFKDYHPKSGCFQA